MNFIEKLFKDLEIKLSSFLLHQIICERSITQMVNR